jgi:ferritin-like metal-binding protein YciE
MENPAPEVFMLFVAGVAGRTEHYKIQLYSGLVGMTRLLGEKDVVKLLRQNLTQEEAMARQVEQVAMKLAKRIVPVAAEHGAWSAPAAQPDR